MHGISQTYKTVLRSQLALRNRWHYSLAILLKGILDSAGSLLSTCRRIRILTELGAAFVWMKQEKVSINTNQQFKLGVFCSD